MRISSCNGGFYSWDVAYVLLSSESWKRQIWGNQERILLSSLPYSISTNNMYIHSKLQ